MEEVQNQELLEQRFFMDDVLTALQQMTPRRAERLLRNHTVNDIITYVNQGQEYWDTMYSYYDELIASLEDSAEDFRELNGLLNATAQEKADRTIVDITEVYKNMDIVDKVRLNRRLQKENTLADSICLLLGTVMGLKGDCHGTETEL